MYLVFEGPNKVGKTAALRQIVPKLEKAGFRVTVSREPGGTKLGQQLRGILLDPRNERMSPKVDMLLFTADRMHLMDVLFGEDAERYDIVIVDRSFISTVVFQYYANGLPADEFLNLIDLLRLKTPDLVIHVTAGAKTLMRRRQDKKALEVDHFETLGLEYEQRVIDGYFKASNLPMFKGKWVTFDGEQPLDVVHEQIYVEILQRITQFRNEAG
ncbi:dTMP kinase [candidate division WWE3 bacterium CG_4_9_14_3_um_filter_41_6]|uniref:Thymidylate kinase n=1 Tax=candidate division WWE3 bacterium CG_4_10_14_0_2_um_filter_41_14 TaxID=1975072 RepID=A0A2M7TIB8_UNCKA|nr:MAG: dTMP kinase [candidate division WWE3 bacterium CG_4_10_14_0_2_um_filter_41_14]PJA38717.1 MAG: dTMP kinase [candidate division WWE3 bacterium CG_4_9_14_3_um_filter_41_6]